MTAKNCKFQTVTTRVYGEFEGGEKKVVQTPEFINIKVQEPIQYMFTPNAA